MAPKAAAVRRCRRSARSPRRRRPASRLGCRRCPRLCKETPARRPAERAQAARAAAPRWPAPVARQPLVAPVARRAAAAAARRPAAAVAHRAAAVLAERVVEPQARRALVERDAKIRGYGTWADRLEFGYRGRTERSAGRCKGQQGRLERQEAWP